MCSLNIVVLKIIKGKFKLHCFMCSNIINKLNSFTQNWSVFTQRETSDPLKYTDNLLNF